MEKTIYEDKCKAIPVKQCHTEYFTINKNKTYRKNRSCVKNVEGEIAPLDALYPTI